MPDLMIATVLVFTMVNHLIVALTEVAAEILEVAGVIFGAATVVSEAVDVAVHE